MKVRNLVASAMIAALAVGVAGCNTSNGDDAKKEPAEMLVWLMKGSAPETAVKAANADFEASHPGVKVKVELQEWANIGTKTTTALGGDNPPAVLEIGNSLTAGFADAGGLTELTDKKADLGGDDWNQGLTDSAVVGGKLFAAPYLAGTRVVIYRKDLYAKAGITEDKLPKTLDEQIAVSKTIMAKNAAVKDFSGFYVPGKYWYMGVGFVYGYGGKLGAFEGGQWKGTVDSPDSVKGLDAFKNFAAQLSKAPKDATEADPPQIGALGTGKAAAIFDAGWQIGAIEKDHPELKGQIGTYALPGPTAGTAMPTFLGGSNLAISARTKSPKGAYDYLKLLTATKFQTELYSVGKAIPNSNTLLVEAAKDPAIKASADAAKSGWFVLNSPKWTDFENSGALQDLFVNVVTSKKTTAEAGKAASEAITKALAK